MPIYSALMRNHDALGDLIRIRSTFKHAVQASGGFDPEPYMDMESQPPSATP